MRIKAPARTSKFILSVSLCVASLQLTANIANALPSATCTFVLNKRWLFYYEYVRYYEAWLKGNNEIYFAEPSRPRTILFNGQSYKIIDFLGSGQEGQAFRVENSKGKRTLMKVLHKKTVRSLPRQAYGYYRMNKRARYPYTIIAIDHENRIFQFDDMRAITLDYIDEKFKAAGLSYGALDNIFRLVALIGADYERNEAYDIDRDWFRIIDPH